MLIQLRNVARTINTNTDPVTDNETVTTTDVNTEIDVFHASKIISLKPGFGGQRNTHSIFRTHEVYYDSDAGDEANSDVTFAMPFNVVMEKLRIALQNKFVGVLQLDNVTITNTTSANSDS